MAWIQFCLIVFLLPWISQTLDSVSDMGACRQKDMFFCIDSRQCIGNDSVCDGFTNCRDGEDESPPACTKDVCRQRDRFFCQVSKQCIDKYFVCNSDTECPDGEDEAPPACNMDVCHQRDWLFCNASQKCINKNFLCDGIKDCIYGEDETPPACNMDVCRRKDMIFCNVSMQCIGRNLVCNGVKDCDSGEDETSTACALKQQCESNWSLSEGCIVRCKPGYFGKFCKSCVDKCLNGICDKQTGICLNCTPGYFGEYCEQNCLKECVNGICNSKSGICKDCTPGYFGEYCEQNCSKECVNGICNSKSGICKDCIPGYFGKFCEETCSNECLNGICNRSSGICKDCIRTYYENCSLECGQECREREGSPQCDRQSGNCLHGCNLYYFGHNCNKTCKNCKGNSSNDPCGINGVCYCGCKNDYWDKNCTTKCNANCKGDEQGNRCNSSTGECLYGCTRGWSGRSCEDVSSVQSTTSESTEKENVNSLKTSLIVISASFIVVLVVAGIICYFWGQTRLNRQLNERKELCRNIQDDVQPRQEPSGSPSRESSSLYADINEESMELYHYICEQNVPDHYEEISVTKYDGNTEIVHLEKFTDISNSRRSITQSEGKNELDSTDETKSRQSVTQLDGDLDHVENTNGIDRRRRFVNSSRSNESVCTNEYFDLDACSQTTKAKNRRMLAAKYCDEEEDIFGDLGQFQVDYIHAIEREECELPYNELEHQDIKQNIEYSPLISHTAQVDENLCLDDKNSSNTEQPAQSNLEANMDDEIKSIANDKVIT